MSQQVQMNISHILQGLALAGILWVGSSIQGLQTAVQVNDWRLTQIEQKART